jgi:hypothetical protein
LDSKKSSLEEFCAFALLPSPVCLQDASGSLKMSWRSEEMVCGYYITEDMRCLQNFDVVLFAIARQNCSASCNSWKRCNGERIALRRLRLMVMWIAVVDDHFGDNMFCARLKVYRDLCMERSWKRRDMIGTGRNAASTQSGATKSCHTATLRCHTKNWQPIRMCHTKIWQPQIVPR